MAIVLVVFGEPDPAGQRGRGSTGAAFALAVAFGAAVAAAGLVLFFTVGASLGDAGRSAGWAFAAGALLAAASRILSSRTADRLAARAIPLALAAFGVGVFVPETPSDGPLVMTALVAGAALGALAGRAAGSGRGGLEFALAAFALGAACALGGIAEGDANRGAGVLLGLGGLLGLAIAGSLLRGRPDRWAAALAIAIALGLAWLVGERVLFVGEVGLCATLGVATGIVVAWLIPEDRPTLPLAVVLAAVLWVGTATVAFGWARGYGVAVTVIGALVPLLALGARQAMVSVLPLVAILAYRLFREMAPEAARAIDIGQHYALLGVLLGIALPLLPLEWARSRREREGFRFGLSAGLAVVAMVVALAGALVVLGSKGAVGLLLGAGVTGLVFGLRSERGLSGSALALASLAVVLVGHALLGDAPALSRDEKIRLLAPMAGALLVLLVVAHSILGTSREPHRHHESTPA